jgi:hypothetical protein
MKIFFVLHGPQNKQTPSSGAQPKKQRSFIILQDIMAVLGLLTDGVSVSKVAGKYVRNSIYIYSTRYIKNR